MKCSKKIIRFLLPLLIIILSIVIPFSCAKGEVKFPAPTNLKYINDYAGVLDMDTKEYLVSVGNELENKTGAQAVIVIIDSLEGNDESSYGNELFRKEYEWISDMINLDEIIIPYEERYKV